MDPLLKKLNFKNHEKILVLSAPEEFSQSLQQFRGFTSVDEAVYAERYGFALVFVKGETDTGAAFSRHALGTDPITRRKALWGLTLVNKVKRYWIEQTT